MIGLNETRGLGVNIALKNKADEVVVTAREGDIGRGLARHDAQDRRVAPCLRQNDPTGKIPLNP